MVFISLFFLVKSYFLFNFYTFIYPALLILNKKGNKTGFQPVSRPVEQILVFPKSFKNVPKKGCKWVKSVRLKVGGTEGAAKSVAKPLGTE